MAKKIRTAAKVKKKIWVQIIAPKLFNEQVLGEIPLDEPSSAIGRHITVNLMVLTRDMRRQNTNVEFELTELIGSRIHTKMIGINISPSAVKRLMRRSKNKIEESFVVQTKDNIYIRIKPLLITSSETYRSVLSAIRHKVREIIAIECKKLDYENLLFDVVSNKLQKTVREGLKKIYPLKISEIKFMKIISPEKAKYVNVVTAKPQKEKPKEEAPEAIEQEEAESVSEARPKAAAEEAKEQENLQ